MNKEPENTNNKPENVNPFEDIRKQVEETLKNSDFSSMFGMTPQGQAQSNAEKNDDNGKIQEKLKKIREFSLKPKEIRDHLDRFVVQQNEAKKVLSVAVCDHFNHVRQCIDTPSLKTKEYAKQNIMLLGPTGVGKTYLMRCIAKLIGVPFVKADATKFSETGYVGHDVEDLVRDLVKAADGEMELAQYGIIYIDEIDKIASASNSQGKDVSGRGVQINLLKLMEDTDVGLQSQTDLIGQVEAIMQMQKTGKSPKRTISTRHILFIVSGAFDFLAEHIKHRTKNAAIGFLSEDDDSVNDAEYLKMAETRDFVDCGFEPEFIGRLPVRVTCNPLTTDDLEEIMLNSEDSILDQYRSDFKGYGIDMNIQPEAIKSIAETAHKEKTGARGLMTVMEHVFRDFKFELPSTPIHSFEVTAETIKAPEETLKKLLKANKHLQYEFCKKELAIFADRFRNMHGLEIKFTRQAADMLVDESITKDRALRSICEEKFRDLHHGLKLIANNSGKASFDIGVDMVKEPEKTLSDWIVRSFSK